MNPLGPWTTLSREPLLVEVVETEIISRKLKLLNTMPTDSEHYGAQMESKLFISS